MQQSVGYGLKGSPLCIDISKVFESVAGYRLRNVRGRIGGSWAAARRGADTGVQVWCLARPLLRSSDSESPGGPVGHRGTVAPWRPLSRGRGRLGLAGGRGPRQCGGTGTGPGQLPCTVTPGPSQSRSLAGLQFQVLRQSESDCQTRTRGRSLGLACICMYLLVLVCITIT